MILHQNKSFIVVLRLFSLFSFTARSGSWQPNWKNFINQYQNYTRTYMFLLVGSGIIFTGSSIILVLVYEIFPLGIKAFQPLKCKIYLFWWRASLSLKIKKKNFLLVELLKRIIKLHSLKKAVIILHQLPIFALGYKARVCNWHSAFAKSYLFFIWNLSLTHTLTWRELG